MSKLPADARVRTVAVHGGEKPDPATGASAPNLVMSTTFLAEPDASFSVEELKEDAPFFYTRWRNPTVDELEWKLALLSVGIEDPADLCADLDHALALAP